MKHLMKDLESKLRRTGHVQRIEEYSKYIHVNIRERLKEKERPKLRWKDIVKRYIERAMVNS